MTVHRTPHRTKTTSIINSGFPCIVKTIVTYSTRSCKTHMLYLFLIHCSLKTSREDWLLVASDLADNDNLAATCVSACSPKCKVTSVPVGHKRRIQIDCLSILTLSKLETIFGVGYLICSQAGRGIVVGQEKLKRWRICCFHSLYAKRVTKVG